MITSIEIVSVLTSNKLEVTILIILMHTILLSTAERDRIELPVQE